MSIKFRLVISYIAMVIIPVILTAIAAVIILVLTVGSFHHNYSGTGIFKQLPERAIKISSDIGRIVVENPDKLKDMKYLEETDRKLGVVNMGIALKSNDSYLYLSRFLNDPRIYEKISDSEKRKNDQFNMVSVGRKAFAYNRIGFLFSDGTPGVVYLITDISPIGQFTHRFFSALGYAVIIIIILTNGVITFFVSRSIIRPLKMLKHGAEQIKEGNLNFEIKPATKDELGEVCVAFEEMRRKLKESIDTQIQYDENRKELISSISHDLKTPITSIKGYVEGIMDGVADTPEKMDKYIKTIYSKAIDMDKLIEDLFLFSKLDLKKMPFNFEKVSINKYFEDCCEELSLDMEKKGMQLVIESRIPDDIGVMADREKLKRVVTNIVENAVKYMGKPGGRVCISLTDGLEEVTVGIQDNGQGINKDDLPYVFDRFYRADSSRSSSTGGSGLGLAIARQIIEGHKGRIWAESEKGQGTKIYFTLKKV